MKLHQRALRLAARGKLAFCDLRHIRPMSTENPQNPSSRRAYCIRPRPELAGRLELLGMADELDFLGEPTIVMTESLPYEGKLEGYRSLILQRCKEAFLDALFDDGPLSNLPQREALLGKGTSLTAAFDLWWTAEEVDTIEIQTTW